MGDLRIGPYTRSVVPAMRGYTEQKGETKKFANIFKNSNISLSAENAKQCEQEGIKGAKKLNERSLADLTATPPLGREIQAPFFSYRS